MSLDDMIFGPGSLYSRYFSAARALKPGLERLASSEPDTDEAYVLLAGFFAEVLLKTAIAFARREDSEMKDKPIYGHDLVALHAQTARLGVSPTSVSADFLRELSVFHDKPFFIRYQEIGGFYSLPKKANLQATLSALYQAVETLIAQSPSAA